MKELNESLMKQGSMWLPRSASTYSDNVDFLFNVITYGSFILFVLLIAITVYFAFKYRRTQFNLKAKSQITHNNALEITWTIIPLIILMGIFVWGGMDYLTLTVPPSNAMEIRVVGKKWLWQFDYPQQGLKTINEIVVPLGQPVKLIMSSDDVIHSFYIPNFRIKKDVVPNRYTRVWFEAKVTGNFQIFCAEYCGDGHSGMLANLRVLPRDEYDEWLKKGASGDDLPLDKLGEKLYVSNACNTCHSMDGTVKTGPSWKGIYGQKRELANGSVVTIDDEYIRESVLDPSLKVVKGYQPVMPTYKGLLNERQINGLIEYIKTLK